MLGFPDGARARRSGRGIVLVEVLMSIMLLAIVAAGSVGMVLVTVRGNAFAGSVQTATKLGQQVIDQLMLEPFATLGVGASSCKTVAETVYATGSANAGGAGDTQPYTRSCAISPLPNGIKVVVVTVQWDDAAAKQHTIKLGTQRAP
jgi:hypothetical protein